MKKYLKICGLIALVFGLSGCIIKKDDFDNIDIYTTVYTIEYLTKELYGEHSTIKSIYPDGVAISDYTITNKKLNDYSKGDLFIYNGLSNEKQTAATLVNKNNKMYIIDVSQGLELKYEESELLLSPSNCLMLAQNIKNGLIEHISNTSILDEVAGNYEELKLLISGYDAELKLIAENASNKTIIVANKAFNFLSKYGFEVINIATDEDDASSTALSRAKQAFSSNTNKYLFVLKGTNESEEIKDLVKNGGTLSYINPMVNLTDEERKNRDNYVTFMNSFIEALKAEVY